MSAVITRLGRLERAVRARRLAVTRMATLPADPVELAARVGLVPDPWQRRVLLSRAPTLLLCCSRQAGKSTIVALLIVFALLQPGRTVVIVSPSERQSKELVRKVLAFWRHLGRPIGHVAATRTSLELVNGSRLEAFPASSHTIRGISAVDLLVADEAAVVADELYMAIAPMLAVSLGQLVALSTPAGTRGWWWALWDTPAAEDLDIERVLVPAPEISRISPTFLARERRRIGEYWYSQEYLCKFQDAQTAEFRSEDIAAAFREEVVAWAL